MQTHKFDIIIPPQDINCEPGLQEKLVAGDREAFAWVYKNYSKKVYSYALLITNNETLSEDIVQDVFVKLWQHRVKLRGHENFNGYFRLLYKNHIMNVLRDSSRERVKCRNYLETVNTSIRDVEDLIAYKETERLIAETINELPKQPRLVIELSREQGMKSRAIAKMLNKKEKTVRGQLYEGLKMLRERLKL